MNRSIDMYIPIAWLACSLAIAPLTGCSGEGVAGAGESDSQRAQAVTSAPLSTMAQAASKLSDQAVFAGVFFGAGPGAQIFAPLWPARPLAPPTAQDRALKFVALVDQHDPSFLPSFHKAVTSGNVDAVDLAVLKAITEVSSVLGAGNGGGTGAEDWLIIKDVAIKSHNMSLPEDLEGLVVFQELSVNALYRTQLSATLAENLSGASR